MTDEAIAFNVGIEANAVNEADVVEADLANEADMFD